MRQFFLSICLAGMSTFAHAQTVKEDIATTISTLFEAMKRSDSTVVKSVIHPDAIFQTVAENDSANVIKTGNVQQFITSVGKSPIGALDEQYIIENINFDHALAQVWVPYEFYYQGKFSHKGTNLFTLVYDGASWKIIYLIDTRIRDK